MEELNLSVKRGAAFLDERVPGWEPLIVLDRLDMAGSRSCVLGQIARHFPHGDDSPDDYWSMVLELELKLDQAIDLGFTLPSKSGLDTQQTQNSKWYYLEEAWKEQICVRTGE